MTIMGWRPARSQSFFAAICLAFALLLAVAPQPAFAQTGTITIIKDAPAAGGQGFGFTSTSPSIGTFVLEDRDFGPGSNFGLDRRTISLPAGPTYTITEAAVPGWRLDQIQCTGGSPAVNVATRTVTVPLAANQNVICTFRNVRSPTGTITIIKDAPAAGGQGFGFTSTSPSIGTFVLEDRDFGPGSNSGLDRRTFGLEAGKAYTITEAAVPGWMLDQIQCTGGSAVGNVATRTVTVPVLGANQHIVCTFRNVRSPTGTITIIKDAPAAGGQGFGFTSTSPSIGTFVLEDRDFGPGSNFGLDRKTISLPAGPTYTITEAAVPGWRLDQIQCTGGSAVGNVAARTVTVPLGANQNVICTFRNVRSPTGTITIIKDAPAAGGQGFGFTSTSPSIGTFGLQGRVFGPGFNSGQDRRTFGLEAGKAYTITEAAVPGWMLTAIECTGGSAVVANVATRTVTVPLAANQNVVCTYRNSRSATLTIIQDSQPNSDVNFWYYLLPGVSGWFTSGGILSGGAPGTTGPFYLDDDSSGPLPNSRNHTVPGDRPINIMRYSPIGWRNGSVSCAGAPFTVETLPGPDEWDSVKVTVTSVTTAICTFTSSP